MTAFPDDSIPEFADLNVGVIGDAMLDRYCFGETSRVSPEAPVPIVRVEREESRPGGAANVALNLAVLGARPVLFGAVGDDPPGKNLRELVSQYGVTDRLTVSGEVRTITKMRIVSRHQQLLRIDAESPLDAAAPAVLADLERRCAGLDALVLSDYAKGTVVDSAGVLARARAQGVPVLIDPKGADFDRYRGAFLLTPNLAEFETVVGPCSGLDDLSRRAEGLRDTLELKALLVTRGERGMSLFEEGCRAVHVPAVAREVYDVTGAGDTVIAVVAACVAAGGSLASAVHLANAAAGLVVGRLGAASVTREELATALAGHASNATGVVDEPALVQAIRAERLRGETVVMTNGCFDLLHLGHVQYLRAARALGDRLVVAVNDDASVARLKGDGRPLNRCDARMQMLAGLASVDWVVPFTEDTPARLIEVVSPDVLVKGGDYTPEEIAGADWVISTGGRVETIPFVEGYSTTRLIESAVESRLRTSAGPGPAGDSRFSEASS